MATLLERGLRDEGYAVYLMDPKRKFVVARDRPGRRGREG